MPFKNKMLPLTDMLRHLNIPQMELELQLLSFVL
jgi:hypothetical protein